MVNVLLSSWNFGESYIKPELSKYIHPTNKVAFISFAHKAFDDQIIYNEKYGQNGKHFIMPSLEFEKYGISRNNIKLVDYYSDSESDMKRKISDADILMFTGGMPDQAITRLKDRGIYDDVIKFNKVIMGYSSGAIIQLNKNFLSPDDDYPELLYMNGLSFINDDFYIEVHYDHSELWHDLLKKIHNEQNKKIYAIGNDGAIIIDSDRKMQLLGDITIIE